MRRAVVTVLTVLALGVGAGPAVAAPGDVLWTYVPMGLGHATATVVGPDGTVYVTGQDDVDGGYGGYYTVALTLDGQVRWTAVGPTGPGGLDVAVAIALDPFRSRVYVTGTQLVTTGGESSTDIVTIGYDMATGAEAWRAGFASPPNPAGNDDEARALVVDPDNGQVVVAGSAQGPGTTADALLVAYSPSGTPVWSRRLAAAGDLFDVFGSLGLDGLGNVYALGSTGNFAGQSGLLASYTRQGTPRWSTQIPNPPGITVAFAGTVLVDPLRGRVYTTASHNPDYSSFDSVEIRAWGLDGTPVWARSRSNDSAGTPRATLGERGEVIFSSIEATPGGEGDVRVSALSSGGAAVWGVTLRRTGGALVTAIALAANDGTAFVTALGDFGQEVYGVATRTSAGTPVFYKRIGSTARARPEAVGLAIGPNVRHLYLAGAVDRARGEQFAVLAVER